MLITSWWPDLGAVKEERIPALRQCLWIGNCGLLALGLCAAPGGLLLCWQIGGRVTVATPGGLLFYCQIGRRVPNKVTPHNWKTGDFCKIVVWHL